MTQTPRSHLIERAAEMLNRAPGAVPAPGGGPPPREATAGPAVPRLATPAVGLASMQRAGLVMAQGGRRQRVLEELGLIQHQVLRCIDEAKVEPAARRRIVLVASALAGEGKSFIALNMAAGIAWGGARPVLLIDADGSARGMTDLLGAGERPGILNMVASPETPPSAVAMPTGIRRLSFVPHGAIRRGDVPAGSTMAQAILRLSAALPEHVVVIDPPPCLSTSDCSALAAVSGQVVFVVDAQRTRIDEVEASLDVLDACPVTRLLLNRMRMNTADTFGANGEYGAPNAA